MQPTVFKSANHSSGTFYIELKCSHHCSIALPIEREGVNNKQIDPAKNRMVHHLEYTGTNRNCKETKIFN